VIYSQSGKYKSIDLYKQLLVNKYVFSFIFLLDLPVIIVILTFILDLFNLLALLVLFLFSLNLLKLYDSHSLSRSILQL